MQSARKKKGELIINSSGELLKWQQKPNIYINQYTPASEVEDSAKDSPPQDSPRIRFLQR